MRRRFLSVILALLAITGSARAQRYDGNLHNYQTDNGLYSVYFGVRAGLVHSDVDGSKSLLKGSSNRTSFNLGVVAGFELTEAMPLFAEIGVSYVQKGGKTSGGELKSISYHLNYFEVPAVLKYIARISDDVTVQPLAGVWAAVGCGGHTKAAGAEFLSFGDNRFKRTDAGLRLGCGVSYQKYLLELDYDYGLVNITHKALGNGHTSAINLTLGMNF